MTPSETLTRHERSDMDPEVRKAKRPISAQEYASLDTPSCEFRKV